MPSTTSKDTGSDTSARASELNKSYVETYDQLEKLTDFCCSKYLEVMNDHVRTLLEVENDPSLRLPDCTSRGETDEIIRRRRKFIEVWYNDFKTSRAEHHAVMPIPVPGAALTEFLEKGKNAGLLKESREIKGVDGKEADGK